MGLNMAKMSLAEKPHNKEKFTNAMLYIIRNTIDDKILSVVTASIELMDHFFKRIKPSANVANQPLITIIL